MLQKRSGLLGTVSCARRISAGKVEGWTNKRKEEEITAHAEFEPTGSTL